MPGPIRKVFPTGPGLLSFFYPQDYRGGLFGMGNPLITAMNNMQAAGGPLPRGVAPQYMIGDPKGLKEPGNLNLDMRTVLKNNDGSISTERSLGIEDNGLEVLIPTVINGKLVSNQDAIAHYRKTGEHLGKFDNPMNSDYYANLLHERQKTKYKAWQK